MSQARESLKQKSRQKEADKRKAAKARKRELQKTRAQELFQEQDHPKRQKKIIRLEQWVEVRVNAEGKVTQPCTPATKR